MKNVTLKNLKKIAKKDIPTKLRKAVVCEPPPYREAPQLLSEDERKEYQKELSTYRAKNLISVWQQSDEKMAQYMDYYEVRQDNPDKWFWLCKYFARDFVDGFQLKVKGSRGRKMEWDILLLARLYYDVQQLLNKGGGAKETASWACMQLKKKSPWKEKKINKDALENRYIEAVQSPLVRFMLHITELQSVAVPKDDLWKALLQIES